MKYTRYDFRRRKEEKISVAVIFISIILAAVLLGTALSSLFIKGQSGKADSGQKSGSGTKSSSQNGTDSEAGAVPLKFLIIQGGNFTNESYAMTLKESLKAIVNPFSVKEEDGKTRVLAGIFNEDEYEAALKKLTDKSLDNSKMTYEINIEDQSCLEIEEIIRAHLRCLTPLTEQNTISVKTDDIKKWLPTLPAVKENSKHFKELEAYKTYISSLPAEIGKDKVEENYIYIYNLLKKVGTKI
ncbi:MAG: hypothetical protein Q8930_00020 [Bacillota bacterium]|nr:hypothetical protein [Bacillota bacterium]